MSLPEIRDRMMSPVPSGNPLAPFLADFLSRSSLWTSPLVLYQSLADSLGKLEGVDGAFVALVDSPSRSIRIVSVATEDRTLVQTLSARSFSLDSRSPLLHSGPLVDVRSAILEALAGGAKVGGGVPGAEEMSGGSGSFTGLGRLAVVPLHSRGNFGPEGVLGLVGNSPDFPVDSMISLLSDLALLLPEFLDRARNGQDRSAAFQTLVNIERRLHASEEKTDRMYQQVADILVNTLTLPWVWIGMVPAGSEEIRIVASAGPAETMAHRGAISLDPAGGAGGDIAVRAVREREIQVVEDLSPEPGPSHREERFIPVGLRSGLADSALTRDGQTLVLALYRRQPGPFPPEYLALVSGLAGDLVAYYDRRTLEKERAQLSGYQEAVRSIQQAFLSVRDRHELFEIVVRTIERVTDSVAAYIMVCPPGSKVLRMVSYSTKDPSLATAISGISFPLEGEEPGTTRTVVASAYTLRHSVVERYSDGLKALRFYQETHPEFLPIRSILATPVFMEEGAEPEAVLAVWSLQENDFTPDLVRLAEQLSESLSRALERLERESELERLSLIAQKTTDGILMTDAQGKIFWVNRAFEEKYGFPLPEIRGNFPTDFRIGPDTDQNTIERIREHLKNGQSFEETMVQYSRDKVPFWVRVNATALRAPSGALVGYVSVETDVTALKESEERVRIASLFYRALSESIQTLRSPSDLPPSRLLSALLEQLRSLLGARLLFLGTVPKAQKAVDRLADAGPVDEWLGGEFLTMDSDLPEGGGAIGIALRTGTPQLFLKEDPDIPAVSGGQETRRNAAPLMGGIAAATTLTNGDRILLFGQFPDEVFLSLESAGLFHRITVEIGAFLDRKTRQELNRMLERYSVARQIIAKHLLSAGSEEKIFEVLARTISRETDSLAVECLLLKGNELRRTALEGGLSDAVGTLPSRLLLDSAGTGTLPPPLRAWTRREPVLVKNPGSDPEMGPFYRSRPFDRVRLVASFPVPGLNPDDPPLGVVTLFLDHPETFENPVLTGLFHDILENASMAVDRLLLHRKMEELSVLDPLTGLLNRRGLGISLQQFLAGIRRGGGIAIVGILDLDDFKRVNDSFGHSSGDTLLVELSRRLEETLRESDLVGRLGGDEFVVVSSLEREEDLSILMNRLSVSLDRPYKLPNLPSPELRIGVSMGVTLYPGDNSDPDGLLRHADEALYFIKKKKSSRARWWSLWNDLRESSPGSDRSDESSIELPSLPFSDAYGEVAKRLIVQVKAPLDEGTASFSGLFYGTLSQDPRIGEILGRFSPEDLLRLKDSQVRHLQMILGEDLMEDDHRRSARTLGRIHAMVGVSSGGLVEAMRIYLSTLQESLRWTTLSISERSKLLSLLTYRSGIELEEQVNGMSDFETGRQSLIAQLTDQMSHLWNWPDFVRRVLKTLVEFDGMTKAALVRPGEGMERFLFEFSSEKPSDHSGRPPGESEEGGEAWYEHPVVRSEFEALLSAAWQEERVIGLVGTLKDSRLPHSGPFLYDRGIRSLVLLPLKNSEDHRFGILVIGAAYPGFFESPFSRTFLSGISSLFSQGWHRFLSRTSPDFGIYSHQYLRRLLSSRRLGFRYHPVIDFSSGLSSKVELLSRLQSGTDPLYPDQFLRAFGRSEQADLFRQGLEAGLDQLRRWEEKGCVLDLAINLPPILLFEPGLMRWLSTALSEARMPSSRLHLELLESDEVYDTTRQIAAITEIAATGIHMDMDDLGSGYSSLLRLRTFHFNTVKIDQGLVRGDVGEPVRLVALMGSLVKLIQGLGHAAVIEGLESPDLLEAACILGADGGQGYVFSRPLPADQVPDWIRSFSLSSRPGPPVSDLGREAAIWLKKQYGDPAGRLEF